MSRSLVAGLFVAGWLALVGCGGKSAATSTPGSKVAAPPAGATELVCTAGELIACCAYPVDMGESCPEEGMPIDGPKVGADPCRLSCGEGEVVVELAPNADERRYGCVTCP